MVRQLERPEQQGRKSRDREDGKGLSNAYVRRCAIGSV